MVSADIRFIEEEHVMYGASPFAGLTNPLVLLALAGGLVFFGIVVLVLTRKK